jgi:probable F420-dependent oxidoreductase
VEVGFIVPHVGRDNVSRRSIDATCDVAEEFGADALWFGDHIAFPYDYLTPYPYGTASGFDPSDPEQFWEVFSVMAYVAARTSRVKLGTGVIILPYRHPLLTAKSVATIDMLSEGRVMFGAGVGWLEEEFSALGLDTFPNRGSVSDEQLEIIKLAWTEERPRFEGQHYRFPEVSVTPKPFQRPHPPILIGGNGKRAFRRVVQFGDYWHAAMLLPDELEDGRVELAAMAREAGRAEAPRTSLLIVVYLTSDPAYQASMSVPQRRQTIAGTPEQVITLLRRYRDAGLDHVSTVVASDGSFGPEEDILALFLKDIWPQVNLGGGS